MVLLMLTGNTNPYNIKSFKVNDKRVTIYFYRSVNSTQNLARIFAEKNYPEYTIIVADEMTMGRGRLNRKWYAGKGGIWFTIILRPKINVEEITFFNILSSLAVAKTIENICGIKPCIKWPNDVLLDNKKVCGILIESSIKENMVRYLLIGIGINLENKLNEEIREIAITLREKGCIASREKILIYLISIFEKLYSFFEKNKKSYILENWKSFSYTLNKKVRVFLNNGEIIEGKAIAIDINGALKIREKNGNIYTVTYEEVYHVR